MDALPNLRKDPVAAWEVAVVHQGHHLLVRELQEAPPKRHGGAEHSQRRNCTSRQRDEQKESEIARECRICLLPGECEMEHLSVPQTFHTPTAINHLELLVTQPSLVKEGQTLRLSMANAAKCPGSTHCPVPEVS